MECVKCIRCNRNLYKSKSNTNDYVVSNNDSFGVRVASRTVNLNNLTKGVYLAIGDYSVIGYDTSCTGNSSSTTRNNFTNGTFNNSSCTALRGFSAQSFSTTKANNYCSNQEYYKFVWLCNFSSNQNISLTRTESYPTNANTQFLSLTAITGPDISTSIDASKVTSNINNGTKNSSRTATLSNLSSGKYLVIANNLYRDYKSSLVSGNGSDNTKNIVASNSTTKCRRLDSKWHDTTGTTTVGGSYEYHYYNNQMWICDIYETDTLKYTETQTADTKHSQSLSLLSIKLQ